MTEYTLHLGQVRSTLKHPSRQAVTQDVWCDRFQASCQVLESFTAFDIPLTLRLSA